MRKIDEDTWAVEKTDGVDGVINMAFLKEHPEMSIIHGLNWDVEHEKYVHSDLINPYGKYGERATFMRKKK